MAKRMVDKAEKLQKLADLIDVVGTKVEFGGDVYADGDFENSEGKIGGTQLYKHQLGSQLTIITNSSAEIEYDGIEFGYTNIGLIISAMYVDNNNGGWCHAIIIDKLTHTPTKNIFNQIGYLKSNGSFAVISLDSSLNDTITAL